MKRFAVGGLLGLLGLLLLLAWCMRPRLLGWSIEPSGKTTIVGFCYEILPNFTARRVDKKLCRNTPFSIALAKNLGTQFFNCKPAPNYVWTDCNPEGVEFLRTGGKSQRKQ